MHFGNLFLSFSLILMLVLCTDIVESAKKHRQHKHRQQGRSARQPLKLRKYPLEDRSSSDYGSLDSPTTEVQGRSNEGRGFMKMWKGMFEQPATNFIIITQPAPTTGTISTTPSGTASTSTTTAAARDGSQSLVDQGDSLMNAPTFNMDEPNIQGTNVTPNTVYGRNRKNNKRRRQRNRNHNRRRNNRPLNGNRKRAELIAQNLAKKPISNANMFAINTGGLGNGGSSSSSSSLSSGLNINANEHIQSIMNALRQQTPIVYNY